MDMTQFIILGGIFAIVIEKFIEVLKGWVPESFKEGKDFGFVWSIVGALFGIGFALLSGMNPMDAAGLEHQWPIFFQIITGVFIGSGSNVWHDVIIKIKAWRDKDQQGEQLQ